MLEQPFFTRLKKSERILIAGAGGGFDLFCGLPLYFALQEQGKEVVLANLSFTQLKAFDGEFVTPTMMKVLPSTDGREGIYFPEWYLSRWFEESEKETVPIYAFEKTGVLPLVENYRKLVVEYDIDTIILVDGGTDSLMRGDEDGLGTPAEDYTSLAAVYPLDVEQKFLVCLGFGVDHFHGVSNDLTFNSIAELTEMKGFLGSLSLLLEMTAVQKYKAATEYVFAKMPRDVSIVSSSILSAIDGKYGDVHATERTKGSKLWINPLMSICWFFDLTAVAERNIILDELYLTEFINQVFKNIATFRMRQTGKIRKRRSIPN